MYYLNMKYVCMEHFWDNKKMKGIISHWPHIIQKTQQTQILHDSKDVTIISKPNFSP